VPRVFFEFLKCSSADLSPLPFSARYNWRNNIYSSFLMIFFSVLEYGFISAVPALANLFSLSVGFFEGRHFALNLSSIYNSKLVITYSRTAEKCTILYAALEYFLLVHRNLLESRNVSLKLYKRECYTVWF
jgi:hypothetical protein